MVFDPWVEPLRDLVVSLSLIHDGQRCQGVEPVLLHARAALEPVVEVLGEPVAHGELQERPREGAVLKALPKNVFRTQDKEVINQDSRATLKM